MPVRPGYQTAILTFAGGWATDFGPSFFAAPQNGLLAMPFLLSADNLLYELDGGESRALAEKRNQRLADYLRHPVVLVTAVPGEHQRSRNSSNLVSAEYRLRPTRQ